VPRCSPFTLPTRIIHGDDQIVPIGASAMISSKIVKGATLKVASPSTLAAALSKPHRSR
jgi:hypothetical protein